jgi:hypothetical protein
LLLQVEATTILGNKSRVVITRQRKDRIVEERQRDTRGNGLLPEMELSSLRKSRGRMDEILTIAIAVAHCWYLGVDGICMVGTGGIANFDGRYDMMPTTSRFVARNRL